jgi:Ca2+-binding RTX toxin-like protein
VSTGKGDDLAAVTGRHNTVNTGKGDDLVALSGRDNRVDTGKGADTVSVDGSGHKVNTGDGDDVVYITGGAGTNWVDGGDGKDSLVFKGRPDDYEPVIGEKGEQGVRDKRQENATTFYRNFENIRFDW